MKTILLVEDEVTLASTIQAYFTRENFFIDVANYNDKALDLISQKTYDVYLLDLKLDGGNGNNLITMIRQSNRHSGILIISSNNLISDKIKSLDIGADDYLVKPFDLQELHARVRSVLRRKENKSSEDLVFNEIEILVDDYIVNVNKNPVPLTKKEFELLLFFVVNKKRLITKESLAHHLWSNNTDNSDNYDFLYVHVRNLRKKLLAAGAKDYITNIHGIGYKFIDE